MMSLATRGCVEKLKRANENLVALYKRVHAFADGDPYTITYDFDLDRSEIIPVARNIQTPNVIEWGVILGDIVHDVRSALDQMVWALSDSFSGPAPDPIPEKGPGSVWRQVAFPIYETNPMKDVRGNTSRWKKTPPAQLALVDPVLRARFERAQPFGDGQDPRAARLPKLHELWIADKHHAVPVVAFLAGVSDARAPAPGLGKSGRIFKDEHFDIVGQAVGPLKEDAPLGRIAYSGPRVPIVDVELDFVLDIALDEPPASPPRAPVTVADLMDDVIDYASVIIQSFVPELNRLP